MPGILIRHRTARSTCHVVPVLAKPYADGGFVCPTCHVLHPVKSVHLWLDSEGRVLVSEGVLEELYLATQPHRDLGRIDIDIVGSVDNPPPLRLGRGSKREQIDYDNRAVRIWTPGGTP